jgi:hypothetical protein
LGERGNGWWLKEKEKEEEEEGHEKRKHCVKTERVFFVWF